MAKKIVGLIKLQVPAGKANPSPPIGPALGQRGLNIMEFCKAFNAQTQKVEPGLPLPVVITAYADKSFTFIIKTPPTTVLIKKAAGIESGSARPHTDKVGKITRKQVEEIAKAKMPDLNAADLEAAMQIVAGSARSMGVLGGGNVNAAYLQAQKGFEKKVDHAKAYPAMEAMKLVKETATAKFDEAVDVAVQPRHRPEEGRPDRARLGRASGWNRQESARRGIRCRRQGRGGQGRRRRPGRHGRSRRAGEGRQDRLRPGDRRAGSDAGGRRARPDPRPARPDAEPEGRHGHRRTSRAR